MAKVRVTLQDARAAAVAVLKNIGWDDQDAQTQADIMLFAERHGNNQGLIKLLKPSGMAPAKNAGKPSIERETKISAVVNGRQAAAMVALDKAVDVAVEKAQMHGIGAVAVRNTSTSSGMLAYYGNKASSAGMVSIIIAGSPETVAMAAGAKPIFGTNPICFGFPRAEPAPPLVFDMSTAGMAWYGVMSAKATGEQLPNQIAVYPNGESATDPDAVLSGKAAILPFGTGGTGSYKGAHLALVVELLASMSGAAVLGLVKSKFDAMDDGHFVLVLDPSLFTDDFTQKVESVLRATTASGNAEDGYKGASIRLPGQRSREVARGVDAAQQVELPTSLWESLKEHGVPRSRL